MISHLSPDDLQLLGDSGTIKNYLEDFHDSCHRKSRDVPRTTQRNSTSPISVVSPDRLITRRN